MRIRALSALLVIGLLLFVAACGDDDDDEPTTTPVDGSSIATATSDADETPTGEATREATEDMDASPTTGESASPTDEASLTDEAAAETASPTEEDETSTATTEAGTPEPDTEIPDSPVGERLTWALDQLNQGATELTPEVIEENFAPEFLEQLPPEQLVAAIQEFAATNALLTFEGFLTPPSTTEAVALIGSDTGDEFILSVAVQEEQPHLFTELLFQPAPAAAELESWEDFDAQFAALAQEASVLVAEVTDGELNPVHSLESDARLAVGSGFKLYVLGELARQIEAGDASWDEELAIRDEWKSLPTGRLQDEPAGATFTLREYAELMISISDNTAADHLLHHLGRENVEAIQAEMGHGDPDQNVPFLSTRELFTLKMSTPEDRVNAYIAASPEERREMLETEVTNTELSPEDAESWTSPRWIDEIEWFASTEDLARTMVWLDEAASGQGLEPIRDILSINPGVPVDEATWTWVGFKGGAELGVLNFTWLLERSDGRQFVLSATLNDRSHLIDNNAAIQLLMGAMNLLASEGQ